MPGAVVPLDLALDRWEAKVRAARPKDEEDFATVLPHLDVDRRRWLHDALTLVQPGHRWLDVLGVS